MPSQSIQSSSSESRVSLIAAVASYGIWGLMPLFWIQFEGMSPLHLCIHRGLWSFPFMLAYSLWRSRHSPTPIIETNPSKFFWLVVSALLIGANWWIYIYGVERHQVFEMSLGYFFSPLLSAAMGVLILQEKLVRQKWIGFWIVVLGVIVYGSQAGQFPILAIGLAITFSLYGLIRKIAAVPPRLAITTEALVLFGVSIGYIMAQSDLEIFWINSEKYKYLLLISGMLTAVPLLLFAQAMKGLSMTTMGLLNYISPTGKFLLALLVFREPISSSQFIAFITIWIGIGIYLQKSLRRATTS